MYVITGATGHTGGIVAKTLLGLGQKVRAIGRSADRLESLAAEGAEPFVCDITDAATLTKAFSGAKAVYAMVPPSMSLIDAIFFSLRRMTGLSSSAFIVSALVTK